jgi:hypothetical protein
LKSSWCISAIITPWKLLVTSKITRIQIQRSIGVSISPNDLKNRVA